MGLMKYGSILRAQIFAAINIRETYVSEIYFRDFVTNVKLSSAKVKRSIVLTKTLTLLKKTFAKLSSTKFYCENKFRENF